jgi:hypothetical protein
MKTKKTKTQCWAVHFLFLDIESMVAEIWLWRSAIVLSMCGKHWVQSSYIPVQSALWFTIFHSLWNIPVESAVYIQSIIWSTIYQYSLWFIYQYRVLIFMYHYSLLSICCLYTSKVYFIIHMFFMMNAWWLNQRWTSYWENGLICLLSNSYYSLELI